MPEERAVNEQRSAELSGERYPTVKRLVPRASGSIRNRLLVAFVGLSLLLAGAITVVSAVVGVQDGRRRAFDNLGVVSSFKAGEIDGWVTDLYADLDPLIPLQRTEELEHIRILTSLDVRDRSAAAYYDALNKQFTLFRSNAGPLSQFDEAFLLNTKGEVVLSTDLQRIDTDQSQQLYFQGGLEGQYAAFVPDPSLPTRMTLVVAQPVLYKEGPSADFETIGVVAGRARSATLDRILEDRTGLGQTGHTYLVDSDHVVLAASGSEKGDQVHSPAIDRAIEDRIGGADAYENHHGDPVLGVYSWLPDLRVALLTEQGRDEVFGAVYGTVELSAGVALVAVVAAIGASLLITRSIAKPLSDLTEVATQIAAGDLEQTVKIERRDEVGVLAHAFNSMTAQLRELIGSLEQRVADRTRNLRTAAEVARAATSVLEPDELLRQTVDLVRERFRLYYVGLFLLDAEQQFAVLRAGTGEAGREMLAQGHRLEAGGDSMIGQCVAESEARIALDVGEEAVRFENPFLPETRSEMALPLHSRGRVIGAMTVQSVKEAAFDEADIAVMQTMADQVAVAIDNARLFTEAETALETVRRAYGDISRRAWDELLRTRAALGYRYNRRAVVSVEGEWRPEMLQAAQTGQSVQSHDGTAGPALAIPIQVRGQTVGVLGVRKDEGDGTWTPEETSVLEALVVQLGGALESARLYRDTLRRAGREQAVGRIVGRMRRAVDIDTLMQATLREMSAVLDARLAFVEMSVSPESAGGDGGNEGSTELGAD